LLLLLLLLLPAIKLLISDEFFTIRINLARALKAKILVPIAMK
jgi:hypothetical protein